MNRRVLPLSIILWIVGCFLFAGAYYQSPLFTSNQNTYFLPGLAKAGYGYLYSDFLAHKTDIAPVFSAMVVLVHSSGQHWIFCLAFFVLTAVYASSLSAIVTFLYTKAWQYDLIPTLLAFLALVHCPWVLSPLSTLIPDSERIIQTLQRLAFLSTNGVAGQYILGHYLQPSAFGVLFLASLALFLRGKHCLAILCIVAAATMHTSLILHAGILTSAYVIVLVFQKDIWKAVRIGTIALVLILPIVFYIGHNFVLSDTEEIHEMGFAISAIVRQPHHAIISEWFSRSTCIQLAIIITGLVLSRRNTPLFIILLVCTSMATGLTILQMISGDLGLALLFPWRSSAWIIPLCTVIILCKVASLVNSAIAHIFPHWNTIFFRRSILVLSISVLSLLCMVGVYRTASAALVDRDRGTVVEYTKQLSDIGQVYLIPVDFERFRLATGLPVFVDWKSFPYRNSEIIEWYERILLANSFYEATNITAAAEAFTAIKGMAPITHIVVPAERAYLLGEVKAELIFQDKEYILARLR